MRRLPQRSHGSRPQPLQCWPQRWPLHFLISSTCCTPWMGPLSTWSSPKGPEWRSLVGDTGNRSCLRGSFFRSWTHLGGADLLALGGVFGTAAGFGTAGGFDGTLQWGWRPWWCLGYFLSRWLCWSLGVAGGSLVVGRGNGGGCRHPLDGKEGGFGPSLPRLWRLLPRGGLPVL